MILVLTDNHKRDRIGVACEFDSLVVGVMYGKSEGDIDEKMSFFGKGVARKMY